MTRLPRLICILALALPGLAQESAIQEQEPPEEDRPLESRPEYVLNPIQADKELEIGRYYYKRQSYRAAARRFEEATKWNPALAEAWLRLGEAQDRLKNDKAARSAFEKFLEVAPKAKEAEIVRKRLSRGSPKG